MNAPPTTYDPGLALTGGRIVLSDSITETQALLVDAGRITGIVNTNSVPESYVQVDVGGRYITPGLIDLHIHGTLNYSFNQATSESWSTILEANAAHGVTALLPTIATDSLDQLEACLCFGRDWMLAAPPGGSQILGIHLEGPFFAPEYAGAQNPLYLRLPDETAIARLLAYAGILKIVSFAPELPGALNLTAQLHELGIIAAAGHSAATDHDVQAAIELGLSHAIHLWSGQSTTQRIGPWRVPGLLETVLSSDELTAEMICDNRHLPGTLMKLAVRALGVDRLCAISDATNGAGLPDGARFNFAGLDCEVHDGVAMLPDHTSFAGSTTLLNQMIPVLTEVVGLTLPEALRMASLTPAQILGIAQRKGSLAVGKDADIAVFNADFTTWRVLIGGKWVFQTTDLILPKAKTF
ncbi:MAG: N-acetylglucosamine-6-phosphate deacetylase [Anaerolineae bacterium]|nr:N-acetylglucosamine-6-phosphate deacetylase [Anaerolineae bacterium]